MTFEEDFPSLKETSRDSECIAKVFLAIKDCRMFYREQDIKEFCLDKQRVREIIYRYKSRVEVAEGLSTRKKLNDVALQILIEELGL